MCWKYLTRPAWGYRMDHFEDGLKKYRDLVEFTRTGYLILDSRGRVIDANGEYVRLSGHGELREILGRSVVDWTAERAKKRNAEAVAQCVKDGHIWDFVTEYACKDGRMIPVEINAKVEGEGESLRIISLCRDITRRKRMESYLEISRDILEMVNDPVDIYDSLRSVLAELRIKTEVDAVGIRLAKGEDFPYFVQEGFPGDFLIKEDSLIERGPAGVCRNEDGSVRLECTCGMVLKGKIDPDSPLWTKWGSVWTNDSFPLLDIPKEKDPRNNPRNECIHRGYASVALVPIKNKDGIVGILHLNGRRKGCFTIETIRFLETVASHIATALLRKRVEEELAKQSDLLRKVIDSTADLIFVKDLDLRTILSNKAYAGALGKKPDEMIGHTDIENGWDPKLVHGNPAKGIRGFENDDREVLSGKTVHNPYDPADTPGGVRIFDTCKTPLFDEHNNIIGLLGIARDISEHKQKEEELAVRAKELEVFYKASIGREERILELKEEVRALKEELGKGTGRGA
ncbi:MAG: PAS domain-containing protein [Candidatus Omnitrophica bacterium]|nr:PAS domain-containing protein [Candidatus Omnitrophota bacterium]